VKSLLAGKMIRKMGRDADLNEAAERRTLHVILFGRATAMRQIGTRVQVTVNDVATLPSCVSHSRLNTQSAIALPNQGGFLQTPLSEVTRRSDSNRSPV
jgi:hypothetical protein